MAEQKKNAGGLASVENRGPQIRPVKDAKGGATVLGLTKCSVEEEKKRGERERNVKKVQNSPSFSQIADGKSGTQRAHENSYTVYAHAADTNLVNGSSRPVTCSSFTRQPSHLHTSWSEEWLKNAAGFLLLFFVSY